MRPSTAQLGPLVALALAVLFFATQSDRFLTLDNLSLILRQVMVVGTLAIGQTLIILTAGIDLSCGMVMALGGIVMTKLAVVEGINAYFAIACGILACMAFGLLNGVLVTRIRLPPFIVTLGTLNVAFALTQLYSGAETFSDLPEVMLFLDRTIPVGNAAFSVGTAFMLVLYALTWWGLRETKPGRHVYAVGNNPEATRLAGIGNHRVLVSVYVLAGALYGIAALLSVSRTGVGDPNAGQTENLDAITAVVLGGTSLFGGRGSVLGTLLGVVIVGVCRNGLTLMGVSSVYQVLVTGILVILAVSADRLSGRGSPR